MINVMINTGQINIGGRELGGKGWRVWIWRVQHEIFSPLYLLFSSNLSSHFRSVLFLSQISIPSFNSLGISCIVVYIRSVRSDILRFYSFWYFC